ncbi:MULTISPECIES: DUF6668 family protein [unclassified Microbacterium]|uniref:DUF6668 family protein n=1 Tax=unclassified Microbacterium TaxID=2609290 RepID=UPI0010F77894|nr:MULTISPECIES: DUF6668 family protein [unclassified Microbacterium]
MSEPLNPWLSRPTTPPPSQAAPVASVPDAVGPVAPQRGIPAPDRVDQLPVHDRGATAALWWVGAHGGSGESTLAALMPGTQAAGHAWPRTPSQTPARTVLVARGDARGLRAAQDAMRQWAAGLVPSVEVLGLVVMADAPGRVPRSLRDLLQVVSGGVPRTWSVPWVEAWRVGEPPALSSSPREVQRLVDELTAILGAAGTTN